MDPIKIVVTNSDTTSTSYEQSQSATELNKTDYTQNAGAGAAAVAAVASAASSPPSLSSTPTPHHHSNGTKLKSISKRRIDLPPLKLSTFEPKNKFHLQIDDHDADDECRKLLLNPLVNKPFPSSQSTTSLNKRVTISSKSAFSRFEPNQPTGNEKKGELFALKKKIVIGEMQMKVSFRLKLLQQSTLVRSKKNVLRKAFKQNRLAVTSHQQICSVFCIILFSFYFNVSMIKMLVPFIIQQQNGTFYKVNKIN